MKENTKNTLWREYRIKSLCSHFFIFLFSLCEGIWRGNTAPDAILKEILNRLFYLITYIDVLNNLPVCHPVSFCPWALKEILIFTIERYFD